MRTWNEVKKNLTGREHEMIIGARYMLAVLLLAAPLIAGGPSPDSVKANSVQVDTLEATLDSLQAQQDDMNVRLLSIRNFLVKRLAAAEVVARSAPDSSVVGDTLIAQRDSVNGKGNN